MTTPNQDERLYGMDALRAIMMLLGLVLHAIVSYMDTPPGFVLPFQDPSRHIIWLYLLFFIHIFRMPIFFIMAGFFTALLYQRRGLKRMALNRLTRIAVPFIIGWIILLPLTIASYIFAITAQTASLSDALSAVRDAGILGYYKEDSTIYLWFLYYLLLLYIASLIGLQVICVVPQKLREIALNIFGWLVNSRLRAVWFSIPTAIILMRMGKGKLETFVSFIPDLNAFAIYSIFFGFGCLLYLRRDLLPTFNRNAWLRVILALLLAPINFWALNHVLAGEENPEFKFVAITAFTGAMITWLLAFGLTGLFNRYLNRPIPIVRYIVDASYWIYLIHVPFIVLIQGFLLKLNWPSGVKIITIFVIATPIWWLSYDLLVRNTFIGVVLNGRRYQRGLPTS